MGDILLQCSGGIAGTVVSGNLNVFLSVSVTNRINADSLATDTALTVDTGGGTPTRFSGVVSNQSISFNGITFKVPAAAVVTLRISNLRGNANQLGLTTQQSVQAYIGTSLGSLALTNNPVTVARTARGLLATLSNSGISCTGSPVPDVITMANLFSTGTRFASTRVTEAFAGSFQARDASTDTGTRFIVRYSGVPAGARLFVPDLVAGSDAAQPTAAGDLGGQASAGRYAPSAAGTLLLARVPYSDANGAGGTPVPAPAGPGVTTLNGATEVPVSSGSGFAVYEVMDANSQVQESAQFPTFVGMASTSTTATIQETVSFAPLSAAVAASASAPIPRFAAAEPASDCDSLGDCRSGYFPALDVDARPLQFSAIAGGAAMQPPGYIAVQNSSGGAMSWTASVTYKNGTGWLTLDPASGINNGSVRVWVSPQKLAAGTYQATITIDAGPLAGTATFPVVLVVSPLTTPPVPPQPKPAITAIVSAANFVFRPLAPRSLATLTGSNLAGKNVTVTFDGIAARLLYTSDRQINLYVPAELGSKSSAQVVVTVDGLASAPQSVDIAPVSPAVFNGGILNQNGTVNGAANVAAPGSIVQVFATGLAQAGGSVWVKIHDRDNLKPLYAGGAPGIDGVEQVNVMVPEDLQAMSTNLYLCAWGPGNQPVCSHPATIAVGR